MAYRQYTMAMQAAAGCVTRSRFVGIDPRHVKLNTAHAIEKLGVEPLTDRWEAILERSGETLAHPR